MMKIATALVAALLISNSSLAARVKITVNNDIELGTVIVANSLGSCRFTPTGSVGGGCKHMFSQFSLGKITIQGDAYSDVFINTYPYYGEGFTATPVIYEAGTNNEVPGMFTMPVEGVKARTKGVIQFDVGLDIVIRDRKLLQSNTNFPIQIEADYL